MSEVVQAGGIALWGETVVLRLTARGEWVFPKGHVEEEETLEQAAVRDVEEGTGLQAKVGALAGTAAFDKDGNHHVVRYFVMDVVRALPSWEEHKGRDSFAVPLAEVAERLGFESLRVLWHSVENRLAALLPTCAVQHNEE